MPPDPGTTTDSPTVTLSPQAIERLQTLIATTPGPPVAGIQIRILRRSPDGFEHQMLMVDEGKEPASDTLLDIEGIAFYVEARNAAYLNGVQVHYAFKAESTSGFEFTNPNPLWNDPLAERIQNLFDTAINPNIASHGGYVDLLGVEGSTAFVSLGGGCQGCGMADVTLKQGIEVAIKDTVPEIEQVVDSTDHDSGENPFYQPSKK